MESSLLKVAADVARAGSFAAVARDTGVDPSSISRQVAALEDELGIRLFERTTRRLHVTEAGQIYFDRAAPALDLLEEAADAAKDVVSEPSGLLRVTTSVAFGERWLMPRIASFRSAFPQIQLELQLSDAVVDLAAERIDLGIRLGDRPRSGSLIAARLFQTRYRVVASGDYLASAGKPEHPADLAEHDGILFSLPAFRSGWHFRANEEAPLIDGFPRPTLTISNALAIRRAALSGLGVALLAEWTIAEDLESGKLIDVFPRYEVSAGDFESAAWMVYLSREYVPARLRAFIDHLRGQSQLRQPAAAP